MFKYFIVCITLVQLLTTLHVGATGAAAIKTEADSDNYVCDCAFETSVLLALQEELKAIKSLLRDNHEMDNSLLKDLHDNYRKDREYFQNELAAVKLTLNNINEQQNTLNERMQNQLGEFNKKDTNECIKDISVMLGVKSITNGIEEYPTSCARTSGIYPIKVKQYSEEPFLVSCDQQTEFGNWTIIQRRQDGSENFNRNWTEYKQGFGNLNGEFWIGLDKLHALTAQTPQELFIELKDFVGEKRFSKYASFAIGNETEAYVLKTLGNYNGDTSDMLKFHKNMKFSTRDVDNDNSLDHCASRSSAGWWYNSCLHCNLNGEYFPGLLTEEEHDKGILWKSFRRNYSLKFVQMMIRPQQKL